MASANFQELSEYLANANIDFAVDTFKCALVTVAPTLTWTIFGNVTNECLDADYTAGGFTCTPSSVTQSGATTSVTFTGTTYASSTIQNIVGGVIYQTGATERLVCYVEFNGGTGVSSDNGDFTVSFTNTLDITV